jgi:hypothetical protein
MAVVKKMKLEEEKEEEEEEKERGKRELNLFHNATCQSQSGLGQRDRKHFEANTNIIVGS